MRFLYFIPAVLLIGVYIFSGCGQGHITDDGNMSVSESDISSQAVTASHSAESYLQKEAPPAPNHSKMVLLNEFVSQITDDSSPLAFRGYSRTGDIDFVSDLRIMESETNSDVNSIDLIKYMGMYDVPKGIPCKYYELFFVDVNFDGYKDLEIYAGPNGTWNTHRIYLIWDSSTNSFVVDPYDISALGLPGFDEEKQLIHSMKRASAADHWYYTHKYIDGALTAIEEVAENAVWAYGLDASLKEKVKEVVPLFDSDGILLMHWVKKQLDTDTMNMVVIEEKYILYKDINVLEEYEIHSITGTKLSQLLQAT